MYPPAEAPFFSKKKSPWVQRKGRAVLGEDQEYPRTERGSPLAGW